MLKSAASLHSVTQIVLFTGTAAIRFTAAWRDMQRDTWVAAGASPNRALHLGSRAGARPRVPWKRTGRTETAVASRGNRRLPCHNVTA